MSKKLVIAEKPSVAIDYASALNVKTRKDGYLENDSYIITWAFGHLFGLQEPEDYDEKYKEWKLDLLPIIPQQFGLKINDNPGAKKQYKTIKELIERSDVEGVVIGTDAGREGELIGRYILLSSRTKKPVYRLWLNSLTDNDIKKGFEKLQPIKEYDNIFYSAQARAECDWLLGINFSRAYKCKYGGKGVKVSIGRCKTPILALICKRDEEIANFKTQNYYEVMCEYQEGYKGLWYLDETSRINKKEDAEKIVNSVQGKDGEVKRIKKEKKKQPHPMLYNLTNLQRALNRKYGYTAQEVLDTMQSLYEKHKILSYPRTSSRHITESMVGELPQIIESVRFGKFKPYADYILAMNKLPITKRLADDSMVSDHTAIIPVNNKNIESVYSSISEKERNVFDEATLVLLAAFYGDYEYESTTVITDVNSNTFNTKGITVIKDGWKSVYKETEESEDEETLEKLPELKEGQLVQVRNASIIEKKTKPPQKYTENSLLQMMENPSGLIDEDYLKKAIKGHGIGTDATRASFIEDLIKRDYVKRNKKNIIATDLGKDIITMVNIEQLKSPDMTAEWEYNLEKIAAGEITKGQFMEERLTFITDGIEQIKNDSSGKRISKEENVMDSIILGQCPKCKEGDIVENKIGYGCTKYKEGCKFFINKEICKKKISEAQVKKLVKSGKTDVMKGFKSKEQKEFDAALKLDENYMVKFDFTKNK